MRELNELEKIGLMVLLPVLKRQADHAQGEYERHLSLLEQGWPENGTAKRGRPSKVIAAAMAIEAAADEAEPQTVVPVPVKEKQMAKHAKSGWAKFNTPAKRKAEMLKRQAVACGELASAKQLRAEARAKAQAKAAGKKAKRPAPARKSQGDTLPRMVGKDHVVAQVAKELGYTTSQGLLTYMQVHNLKCRKVKLEGVPTAVNVMSQAEYLRLTRMKGVQVNPLDKITEGMSPEEKQAVHELEQMTAGRAA